MELPSQCALDLACFPLKLDKFCEIELKKKNKKTPKGGEVKRGKNHNNGKRNTFLRKFKILWYIFVYFF